MSYPTGQLLSGPITNGSAQAKFGTHISFLGTGGYREVATLADRDAIQVKGMLEFDGSGTGMRRAGMLVYVVAEAKTYRLDIAGFATMTDQDKLTALSSNTHWLEVEFGIGAQGDTIQTFSYDQASCELSLVTNISTFKVDLSPLDVAASGATITSVTLDTNYNLNINLSDGSKRSISLASLAAKYEEWDNTKAYAVSDRVTHDQVLWECVGAYDPTQQQAVEPLRDVFQMSWQPVIGVASALTKAVPTITGNVLTISTNKGNNSVTLPAPDVNKAYVDAADANLQAQLNGIQTTKAVVGNFPDYFTPISVSVGGYYYGPNGTNYIYKRVGPSGSFSFATTINDTTNWTKIQGTIFGFGFKNRDGATDITDNDSAWRKYDGVGPVVVYRGTIVYYQGNSYRYIATTTGLGVTLSGAVNLTSSDWEKVTYSAAADVNKAYVDATDAGLQTQITTEKNRMDTLVANAPQALDTLAEIAAQLAADEAGAAAILATQQQHTQELTNVVHKTGDETIAGNKTLSSKLTILDNSASDSFIISNTNSSAQASFLLNSNQVGWSFGVSGSGNSTLQNSFFINQIGVGIALAVDITNRVGLGTVAPTEKLDVNGNVKAVRFIGDGSQLTNLPAPNLSNYAKLNTINTFTNRQIIRYANSFTNLDPGGVQILSGGIGKASLLGPGQIQFTNYNNISIPTATIREANNILYLEASYVQVSQDPVNDLDVATKQYVDNALANAGNGTGGASAAISRFTTFTVSTDGAQTITLPAAAQDAINVMVLESGGFVRTIWAEDYSVSGNILHISADANLKAGDKISGSYFTQSAGNASGNATNMYVYP